MKKVIVTAIALTAIGVAVRARDKGSFVKVDRKAIRQHIYS
ncbi:hypothetical protein [Marinilactibacillus psychrotolerans]|nr:hypothetical protein [Marinilactibacillus psychrotolerans]